MSDKSDFYGEGRKKKRSKGRKNKFDPRIHGDGFKVGKIPKKPKRIKDYSFMYDPDKEDSEE